MPIEAKTSSIIIPLSVDYSFDSGQPTPITQELEDLCPSDELTCQLVQDSRGSFRLEVVITPGNSLDITDLCHTLLGLTAASGPCENQIVGPLGTRTRTSTNLVNIPLTPNEESDLGLATNTGLGGEDRFVGLKEIITGLEGGIVPPSPADLETAALISQHQPPQRPTTVPLPTTPISLESQSTNQTSTSTGPFSLLFGVFLAAAVINRWHKWINKNKYNE